MTDIADLSTNLPILAFKNQLLNNSGVHRKKIVSLLIVSILFLTFCGSQRANAYGKFPNCNPNTTPDASSRWVDGGATPWMCFTISSVEFTGNPIQISGHGVISQLDIRGQISGIPCKIQSPDCDGVGISIWQLTLTQDGPVTFSSDQLLAPPVENCGFQALYQNADKFISTDPQPVFIVRPILDQQSAENTLNGAFDIKIPFYLSPNCAIGNYHISAEWYSGSWSGGIGMVGIQGNSLVVGAAGKSAATQPQTTAALPSTSPKTKPTESVIPIVEPSENSGNSISLVRTSSKLTRINISTDYPETKLKIVASAKSGKKKLTFNISTDTEGNFSFKTSTNLRGYTLVLFRGVSELDRVLG